MIGFIKKWIEKRKEEKRILNETCDRLIGNIEEINTENKGLFNCETEYIEPNCAVSWEKRATELSRQINEMPIRSLKKTANYSKLQSMLFDLEKLIQSNQYRIRCHNYAVAQKQIQAAYALIGDVEGRKLDAQQMGCIVKKAHSHLVIAGAGTGKTTTVVGKIKYLLKTQQCRPQDILVLSFTNASAAEMSQRIHAETGEQIAASTFHKLGLNIITKVNGKVPKITQLNLRKFVKEQLQINMRSEAYLTLLSEYLACYKVHAKSEFEFKTQEEYQEYLILNPPATIKNEMVKSYGEMDIANFLARNGITYIYEYPYEHDTRTSEYGQYHPDFYLPEYKIYIEYFGINRKGEVPSYFTGKNGMSATQSYQESMQWKRSLHAENKTVMVECFAYEQLEGSLQENLSRNLAAHGVKFKPVSPQELWSHVAAEGESVLDGLIELFETVINLIKSNGYTIDTVRQNNIDNSNRAANEMLLSLVEPIYHAYVRYL